MIKRLVRHGHSRAIVIEKSLLEAAGLSEDALFQITLNPRGGLVIQSLDRSDEQFEKHFQELSVE
ncbi:MAG: hypothetical protein JSS10_03160 [Verrucomicrobia bacterium]|nr:hypothetical protein [Verrucomicrobiota bacterium]